MDAAPTVSRRHIVAAIAAAAVQLLLALALLDGLVLRRAAPAPEAVHRFEVRSVPAPVPPPPPLPRPAPAPKARAPVPRPPPAAVRVERLPQVTLAVAPTPLPNLADGSAQTAGTGTAPGGGGTGGDGSSAATGTPARRLKGEIRSADYPDAAYRARIGGSLTTRFIVGIDGRVRDCVVTVSSGNAALDAATCALVIKRYRYAPARDAAGQPVPVTLSDDHSWIIADDDPR